MSVLDYFGGNLLYEHRYNQLRNNIAKLKDDQTEAEARTTLLWRSLRLMRATNVLMADGYSPGRNADQTCAWARGMSDFTDAERGLMEPKMDPSKFEIASVPQRNAPVVFHGLQQYIFEEAWDWYRAIYGEYADHERSLDEMEKRADQERKAFIAWIGMNDKVTAALSLEMKRFAYLEGAYTVLFPGWTKRYCVMDRGVEMAVAAQYQLAQRVTRLSGGIGIATAHELLDLFVVAMGGKRSSGLESAPAAAWFLPSGTTEYLTYWPMMRTVAHAIMRPNWEEFAMPVNQAFKFTIYNDTPFAWSISKKWPGRPNFDEIDSIGANEASKTLTMDAETMLLFTQDGHSALSNDRPTLAYFTAGWNDADVHLTYNRGLLPIPLA